jgi:hypothetical protein
MARAEAVLGRRPESVEEAVFFGAGARRVEDARPFFEEIARKAHSNLGSSFPVEVFLERFVSPYLARYEKFLEKRAGEGKRGA